jgi:hypothetical protein
MSWSGAWEDVRRNGGAAGIDRVTITDVEEYGVSRLLDEVAAALREGRWRPLPSRRVFIPKPGSSEQRPLSIPNQSQTAATNDDQCRERVQPVVVRLGHRVPVRLQHPPSSRPVKCLLAAICGRNSDYPPT